MIAADSPYQEALHALQTAGAPAAFQALRPALEYPARFVSQEHWTETWELFAQIGGALAGEPFAAGVRIIAANPDDISALYSLGYQLVESGLPGIAATLLGRANTLLPDQPAVLTELAIALGRAGYHHEACSVLRQSPTVLEESFTARYLLAFHSLMTGNLVEPQQLLSTLRQPQDETEVYLSRIMTGAVRRAEAIRGVSCLNHQDLRGWHFVLMGGVLLHLSPYGFDEGMNGRYAYIQDTESLCLEGIRRLAAVLDAWQLQPPRIFGLPDRDSAILSQAASQALGCPVETWPDAGSPAPGLIVAYDLSQVAPEMLSTLQEHRPRQILWAHASCWTEERAVAADLTTYLYQMNVSPWAGGLALDPDSGELQQAAPVAGSIEELATRLLHAPLAENALADLPALVTLAKAAASLFEEDGAGALMQAGRRCRQWVGSPVMSRRFV